jgi:putative ABC transport system ATP-binding protein
MSSPALIEVVALSKAVSSGDSQLTIVHEVSFSVQAGETVAIVGASGSGKSTLLGLLAGLDQASSGEVRLAGHSLAALDEDGRARWRAKHLGFVFQSFQLLPALTALENVMLPLQLAAAPDAENRARTWLQRVGLGQRLGHLPKHLSGGEQQRVALARAFVGEPQVVLADEPTGNLDAATGELIIDLMFALNAEQGTTLILVTHDDAIARRCGRQLRMQAGRLSELGAGA